MPPPIPASRDLQNYILRDFVESLLPMENVLREALYSPRAFEQALLGDFSPFRLAEQIGQAFRSGRRSAIATCFQFVELLRIVASLSLPQLAEDKLQLMEEQRKKAIESIVALAHALTECDDFRGVLADKSSDYRHPKLRVVVEEIVRRCDVHHLSKQIAKSLRNSDYVVAPSRLCDIERKGATPNLYRLHAPSLAYDCKLEQLLKFYGIAKDHLVAGVVARSEYRCLKRLGYNKARTIFTDPGHSPQPALRRLLQPLLSQLRPPCLLCRCDSAPCGCGHVTLRTNCSSPGCTSTPATTAIQAG